MIANWTLSASVLIETLWNVKMIIQFKYFSAEMVLIETLWNVKRKMDTGIPDASFVLIETLWNVKLYKVTPPALTDSINRNIVECKVYRNSESFPLFLY